jgi:hypothetical protein
MGLTWGLGWVFWTGEFMRRVLLLALLVNGGLAQARDLANRLGIGYSDQFGLSSSLPSVAMRYYPNADYGIMGALGVDTDKNNSRFGFSGKVVKIVFREDNLNFYTGAGAGLISQQLAGGTTNSGFEISGVAGAEFFLPGLENLGFSFEAGVGVTSISSQVRFRTIGDSPLKAGIIFYF